MYTDEQLNAIWQAVKALEGTTIEAPEMTSNLRFSKEARAKAKGHEWLYHCTNVNALFGIIKNWEFWLTNLKLVNDKEEARRIDVSAYEKSYYVGCFTYANNVTQDHWQEYGNLSDGVILGVKQEWFERNATFMTSCNDKDNNDFFKVYPTREDATNAKMFEQLQNKRLINPYSIGEFDFYQVVYDDSLIKNIRGNGSWIINGTAYPGATLTPTVVGIVKSTKGICGRPGCEPYMKDWTTEKEIRLIVRIDAYFTDNTLDFFFPKVAVPLKRSAFDELKIRFSPYFDSSAKVKCIEEIQQLLPLCKIEQLVD